MIFHITSQTGLKAAQANRRYRCASLQSEGFIHCCKAEQLSGVVQRYYQDVAGLMVLSIDPDKLQAELVYENTVGGEELFPHVYGDINMDAVVQVAALAEHLAQTS